MGFGAAFGQNAFGFLEYGAVNFNSAISTATPPGRTFTVPANGRPLRVVATKAAQEIIDFALDWTALLDGDTIVTSTWSISLPGPSVTQNYATGTLSTVWLAGGTPTAFYDLTNTITTLDGRTESATFKLEILQQNYV